MAVSTRKPRNNILRDVVVLEEEIRTTVEALGVRGLPGEGTRSPCCSAILPEGCRARGGRNSPRLLTEARGRPRANQGGKGN